MTDPSYTADEVDAAVQALSDPERLEHAQQVVTHAAPGLARVLDDALTSGGWFGEAHERRLREVAEQQDDQQRVAELRALLDEETRLGMLVGVTVGFELAHELIRQAPTTTGES